MASSSPLPRRQSKPQRYEVTGVFIPTVKSKQLRSVYFLMRQRDVWLVVSSLGIQLLHRLSELVPLQYQGFSGAVLAIFGIPNVGKSTVINSLRNTTGNARKRGAKTGAKPGLTRQFSAFQISKTPPLSLMDSPGVMTPRIDTVEDGLKLALTGKSSRLNARRI